jgi:hypothetical protein
MKGFNEFIGESTESEHPKLDHICYGVKYSGDNPYGITLAFNKKLGPDWIEVKMSSDLGEKIIEWLSENYTKMRRDVWIERYRFEEAMTDWRRSDGVLAIFSWVNNALWISRSLADKIDPYRIIQDMFADL